jgi:hypothetical protein
MPTIARIARTINGPNEVQHLGQKRLEELQDIRWGQLKSQDQLALMRTARFVQALFAQDAIREALGPVVGALALGETPGNGPPVASGHETRDIVHPGTMTPPAGPVLGVDRRSVHNLLQLFRAFVTRNATQWTMGSNHHPIWQDVAVELDSQDLNYDASEGPDWAFIQPENRKPHQQLVEEYVDLMDERAATEAGG